MPAQNRSRTPIKKVSFPAEVSSVVGAARNSDLGSAVTIGAGQPAKEPFWLRLRQKAKLRKAEGRAAVPAASTAVPPPPPPPQKGFKGSAKNQKGKVKGKGKGKKNK
jgi:hypothetical protein